MSEHKTQTALVSNPTNGHEEHLPLKDLQLDPLGDAPDIGTGVELVRLNVAQLNSAGLGAYQRPIDEPYVQFLVENWDWNSARVLLVNQRPDGTYWIVDGQHRAMAIQNMFGNIEVWCYLIHVEGVEQEAEIYERVSDGHSKLSPLTLFRGRLTRNEPVAVDIRKIALEEGYTLALTGKAESEFHLTTPAPLLSIYKSKNGGPVRLRSVLKFCKQTWAGQNRFASSQVISGVAKFLEFYADHAAFDFDRVSEVMTEVPLATVIKQAEVEKAERGGHRHICFARAMQSLHNRAVPGGKRRWLWRKGEN